ncbi:MAG: hypothetical protein HC927_02880 [Deltaproteobacteria bacterium]|nr:hypothetical protein [Deltaproteobacteria bacterium]
MIELVEGIVQQESVRLAARASVRDFTVALANHYPLELYGTAPENPEYYGKAEDKLLALALHIAGVGELLALTPERLFARAKALPETTRGSLSGLERCLVRSENLLIMIVRHIDALLPSMGTPLELPPGFGQSLHELLAKDWPLGGGNPPTRGGESPLGGGESGPGTRGSSNPPTRGGESGPGTRPPSTIHYYETIWPFLPPPLATIETIAAAMLRF